MQFNMTSIDMVLQYNCVKKQSSKHHVRNYVLNVRTQESLQEMSWHI